MRKQPSKVRNNHIVAVLGTVVVKFLICYTLPTLLNVIEFTNPDLVSHWTMENWPKSVTFWSFFTGEIHRLFEVYP